MRLIVGVERRKRRERVDLVNKFYEKANGII